MTDPRRRNVRLPVLLLHQPPKLSDRRRRGAGKGSPSSRCSPDHRAHGGPRCRSDRNSDAHGGLPRQSQACHLSVHVRRRPRTWTCFDYKPGLKDHIGQELPASIRRGPAPHRHDQREASSRSRPLSNSPSTEIGTWFSELLPHTASLPTICVVRSVTRKPSTTTPPCTFIRPGRSNPARPSIGSWLSLWPGQRNQNMPAYIVHDFAGHRAAVRPAAFGRLWGSGFLPSDPSGRETALGGRPGSVSSESSRCGPGRRRAMLDRRRVQPAAAQQFGDPEIITRIAQYEMAYRMQSVGSRPDGLSRRARSHAANCTAPKRTSPAPSRRTACWRGGLWSGAFASCSSSTGAGTSTATFPANSRAVPRHGSAVRRVGERSETARPAGRHAGDLGRRVRAHGLQPGRTDKDRLWARPSWPVLHALDRGRRLQGRPSYGETDDFCYNVDGKIPSISTT